MVLARLQWAGQRSAPHEWGVLGTASAAFSHCEGNEGEGQEAITVRIPNSSWASHPHAYVYILSY